MTVFRSLRGHARWERERMVEPYLGDIPDDPKPIAMPVRRKRRIVLGDVFQNFIWLSVVISGVFAVVAFLIAMAWIALHAITAAHARDSGQYAQASPEMRAWFNSLSSRKGNCCSIADGRTITDADTDIRGSHFWVRIDGEWIEVPDDALVTVPNRIGVPIVWPMKDGDGKTTVRCFLPGSGA